MSEPSTGFCERVIDGGYCQLREGHAGPCAGSRETPRDVFLRLLGDTGEMRERWIRDYDEAMAAVVARVEQSLDVEILARAVGKRMAEHAARR